MNIECLVSIGTGKLSLKAFGDDIKEVAESLLSIATETETTAESFAREHRYLIREQRYFRFSVEKGLQNIGLKEAEKTPSIVAATKEYIDSQAIFDQVTAFRETMLRRVDMSSDSMNFFGL